MCISQSHPLSQRRHDRPRQEPRDILAAKVKIDLGAKVKLEDLGRKVRKETEEAKLITRQYTNDPCDTPSSHSEGTSL